ncbi:MAG TPA: diaminopimelate epimerase [Saprospiraceae bacterium]|nr:diaminopimelate epimerase [Saprospiraceae bacterium]HND89941.1 diaminopimelate epimerase [Saprospiraceae bacterium]HNG89337.1 diaminopimelate epimerase [Saprospiraceae bacterium]
MHFYKYQGAGNDFVMLDQRQHRYLSRQDTARIAELCDRRFGIGGDGLILLQLHPDYDFEMIYFNADGRESTLCGNGGRCIAAFAKHLSLVQDECRFLAIDGPHEARLSTRSPLLEWVELHMSDLPSSLRENEDFVLDTGSPHYVRFVPTVDGLDMVAEGRAVRYAERFRQAGINVNLVSAEPSDGLRIRTYERGVEDETLACGTGVTAAALAAHLYRGLPAGRAEVPVWARGGDLAVRYTAHPDGSFTDIWLCGPAARVFEGEI